jgi:hypothetical protein
MKNIKYILISLCMLLDCSNSNVLHSQIALEETDDVILMGIYHVNCNSEYLIIIPNDLGSVLYYGKNDGKLKHKFDIPLSYADTLVAYGKNKLDRENKDFFFLEKIPEDKLSNFAPWIKHRLAYTVLIDNNHVLFSGSFRAPYFYIGSDSVQKVGIGISPMLIEQKLTDFSQTCLVPEVTPYGMCQSSGVGIDQKTDYRLMEVANSNRRSQLKYDSTCMVISIDKNGKMQRILQDSPPEYIENGFVWVDEPFFRNLGDKIMIIYRYSPYLYFPDAGKRVLLSNLPQKQNLKFLEEYKMILKNKEQDKSVWDQIGFKINSVETISGKKIFIDASIYYEKGQKLDSKKRLVCVYTPQGELISQREIKNKSKSGELKALKYDIIDDLIYLIRFDDEKWIVETEEL